MTARKKKRIRVRDKGGGSRGSGLYANACKCDADLVKQVYQLARKGAPLDRICDLLCVSVRTARRWLQRGEMYEDNEGKPKSDLVYAAFRQQYRKGLAEYLSRWEDELRKGAEHYATASEMSATTQRAIEILKRRDRRNWSAQLADDVEREESSQDPDMRYL